MACSGQKLELNFSKPTVVRFEFNGELSLQQTMNGPQEFELCGLVPDADGTLVLLCDGEETMAWDFAKGTCACSN